MFIAGNFFAVILVALTHGRLMAMKNYSLIEGKYYYLTGKEDSIRKKFADNVGLLFQFSG